MPTGYQIDNQSGLYFLTLQVVDWVDVFTRQVYLYDVGTAYAEQDALLMNTVTLYSSSGVDTFSGFDVPIAYPLLHDLLSRMPEVLNCE